MKTSYHTLLVSSLLFGYLFLSVFSPSHMGSMGDMDMSMADCPYLPFQHSAGKSLGDHLAAWSSFVLIVNGELFLLAALFTAGSFLRLERLIPRSTLALIFRFQPLIRPPIHTLFATGILHPRIP